MLIYPPFLRPAPPLRTAAQALAVSLLCGGIGLLPAPARAQAAGASPPARVTPADPGRLPPAARVEVITIDGDLAQVQETRAGGQTLSIEVKPKSGAPGYEIAPLPGGASLNDGQGPGNAGRSRWRVFSF